MKQKKIIVADSSRIFLDLECSYFKKIGCITLGASTGEEALRLAKNEKPDLILLDYELSDAKGVEVCRKLKDDFATKAIPVIMMAADADKNMDKEVKDAGAVELLQKPLKQRELIFRTASLLKIPLRFDISLPVSIMNLDAGGRLKIQGQIIDLSESGAKIESGLSIEKNTMLALEFSLPGSSQNLRLECQVMRVEKTEHNKCHCGVRFTNPDERTSAALQKYLSSLSARVRT